MMTKMRENTAVILWILVAAFVATIVFSWGMGGFDSSGGGTTSTVVGKVNGQELDIRRYEQLIANRVNNGPQPPDDNAVRNARGTAWDDLKTLTLVEQQMAELDLQPRAGEITDWVTYLPPAPVLGDTTLLNNGQFDTTRWIDRLLQNDVYRANIEAYVRDSYPYQKLYQRIYSAAGLSQAEMWDNFLVTRRNAECRFVAWLSKDYEVDSTKLTDTALKAWYDANREQLHHEELRDAQYVNFVAVPSAEDSADARDQLDYLKRQLDAGETFEDLARIYSADESNADKGGDLGWFERGRMVKPFADAAFDAEVGSIVGPVETRFGVHMIKVNGHEERENSKGEMVEQVKAQHILIKTEVSTMTHSDLRARVDAFVEDCRAGGNFADLAKEYGVEVREANRVTKTRGSVPGVGRSQRAADMLFEADPGDVIDPVFNRASGWFVYRLTEISPEGVDPFDKVRDQVVEKLAEELRVKAAVENARAWYAVNGSVSALDSSLVEEPARLIEPGSPLKINGYVRDAGRDLAFTTALFDLEAGQISDVIHGEKGAFVIECLSIDSVDSLQTVFNEELDKLRSENLQSARNSSYANWKSHAEDNAVVDDRRLRFNFDY